MGDLFPWRDFTEALAKRLLDSQVLFFFAAGASVNWKYPTAGELADSILKRLEELMETTPGIRDMINSSGAAPFLLPVIAHRQAAAAAKHHLQEGSARLRGLRPSREGGTFRARCRLAPRLGLAELTDWFDDKKCCFLRHLWVDLVNEREGTPLWPDWQDDIRSDPVASERVGLPHVVLGRLAKEGLIREVFTTNYDHLLELGCWAVGMVPAYVPERPHELSDPPAHEESEAVGWPEAFRVVSDQAQHALAYPDRLAFRIVKLHGSIEAAKARMGSRTCNWTGECKDLHQEELNQVITHRELLTWRQDSWARDLFVDRVRSHHLVFIGFSGTDPVLHATLRDTFSGALKGETGLQAPLPGDMRAQAIDLRKNPPPQPLMQILRAARKQGMPDLACQLAELTPDHKAAAPKQELNALFKGLYVTVAHNWIKRELRSHGYGILSDWLPRAKPEEVEWERRSLEQWLDRIVTENREQGCAFLYDALPGALRWSWLSRGSPVLREKMADPARFGRPHYYVPLHHELNWLIALLGAYKALEQLGMKFLRFEEDGWVEIKPDFHERWGAVRALPLVTPRRENLQRLAAYRSLTQGNLAARHRQPAVRMIFLTLHLGNGLELRRAPRFRRRVPWNEVSAAMGALHAEVLPVKVHDLWTKKGRTRLKDELTKLAAVR